jgi:hypothetical protein
MNRTEMLDAARRNPAQLAEAQEYMQGILARSATDIEFRQQLLSDPHAAISAFTGRPANKSVNVVFVENKAAATVVLPDVFDPNAELSESELEAVAGGTVLVITAAVLTCIVMGACMPD